MAVQGVGPSHHLLSPCPLGLAAWEEYPTLKMLMEMVMTKYGGAHPAGTGPPGPGQSHRAGGLSAGRSPGCPGVSAKLRPGSRWSCRVQVHQALPTSPCAGRALRLQGPQAVLGSTRVRLTGGVTPGAIEAPGARRGLADGDKGPRDQADFHRCRC